eukprot:1379227-Pyramimonas_sp.AAC.1
MEVDDDGQGPPYLGRGAWNVLDYHWNKGNYAENVNSPSYEWEEKCQAIIQIARQNGHPWVPFVGEDIAAMVKTGQAPASFFHPLCKMQATKKHKFWS